MSFIKTFTWQRQCVLPQLVILMVRVGVSSCSLKQFSFRVDQLWFLILRCNLLFLVTIKQCFYSKLFEYYHFLDELWVRDISGDDGIVMVNLNVIKDLRRQTRWIFYPLHAPSLGIGTKAVSCRTVIGTLVTGLGSLHGNLPLPVSPVLWNIFSSAKHDQNIFSANLERTSRCS